MGNGETTHCGDLSWAKIEKGVFTSFEAGKPLEALGLTFISS